MEKPLLKAALRFPGMLFPQNRKVGRERSGDGSRMFIDSVLPFYLRPA